MDPVLKVTKNEISYLLKNSIPKPIPSKISFRQSGRKEAYYHLTLEMVNKQDVLVDEESLKEENPQLETMIKKLLNRQFFRLKLLIKDYNFASEVDIGTIYKKTRIIRSNYVENFMPMQLDLEHTPAISILTYHYDENLFYPENNKENNIKNNGTKAKRFLNYFVACGNSFVWIVSIPGNQEDKEAKFSQINQFLNLIHSLGVTVFYYGNSTLSSTYFISNYKPDYYITPKLTSSEGDLPQGLKDHILETNLPGWLSDYESLLCEIWIKLKRDPITNILCTNLVSYQKRHSRPPIQNSFYNKINEPTFLSPEQEQYLILLATGILHLGFKKLFPNSYHSD